MPWTPLNPKSKRAASKLNRRRHMMRPSCHRWHRKEIAKQHSLGFWDRIKFWFATKPIRVKR